MAKDDLGAHDARVEGEVALDIPASRTQRAKASGQSDCEFGLDLILDGLERMAYR